MVVPKDDQLVPRNLALAVVPPALTKVVTRRSITVSDGLTAGVRLQTLEDNGMRDIVAFWNEDIREPRNKAMVTDGGAPPAFNAKVFGGPWAGAFKEWGEHGKARSVPYRMNDSECVGFKGER